MAPAPRPRVHSLVRAAEASGTYDAKDAVSVELAAPCLVSGSMTADEAGYGCSDPSEETQKDIRNDSLPPGDLGSVSPWTTHRTRESAISVAPPSEP